MLYYVSKSNLLFPDSLYQTATIDDVLEYFKDHKVIQVDTETTGLNFLDDRLLLIQLGDRENQYVINTECDFHRLSPILESEQVLKILHNVKFDYKFLKKAGITLENVYDTMLAEKILNTGREDVSASLYAVTQRYLNLELSKQIRETFIGGGSINSAQIAYAGNDVLHLEDIRELQLKEIAKYKLEKVLDLENQAVLAFADIEYNGMAVDQDKWLENAKLSLKAIREKELALDNLALSSPELKVRLCQQLDLFNEAETTRRTAVNWNSSKQVGIIFSRIIPDLEGVGKDILYPLRRKHPIISMYLDFKKSQKLYNSYGPAFLNLVKSDGRLHPEFNQILNTGRVSCSDPNMQQIPQPDAFRNCFIAGIKDYVFVSSDYKSQELCVIAYGSGDPVWLQALQLDQDLHSICAELLFGEKWKKAAEPDCEFYTHSKLKCECAEHKKLRNLAKTINFGLAYGMSAYKLADRTEIPIEDAEKLIEKYFTVFPKIRFFLKSLGNFGKANGFIKTYPPYSRIRWFDNWSKEMDFKTMGEIERASMNTPIQGSSADMTKQALVYARRYIKKHKLPVFLVMTVHDQIDSICPKEIAEKWKRVLDKIMEHAALQVIRNGLLKADTNVSVVWKK